MPDDTIPDDDILAGLAPEPAEETETPAPEPADGTGAAASDDAGTPPAGSADPAHAGGSEGSSDDPDKSAGGDRHATGTDRPSADAGTDDAHAPAVAPQTLAVDDPDADAWREYQAKAGELRQKLKGGTYDAIEDASKSAELNLLHQDLMNRQLHRQQEQLKAERFWSTETQQHGLPRPQLEKLWTDTWSAYAKKYPNHDPQSYHLAAVEAYQQRVAGARATKPKPAAAAAPAAPATPAAKPPTTPPPPVNKGGARITTPGSNANRPPPPKPKDAGEEFDKAYGPSVGSLLN